MNPLVVSKVHNDSFIQIKELVKETEVEKRRQHILIVRAHTYVNAIT